MPQRRDNLVEALPVARRAPHAAIDHELAGALRHLGIEIVHQHAQGRFGQPALGAELGAAGGADDTDIVETVHHVFPLSASSGTPP